MSDEEKSLAAQDLARKRWEKTSARERKKVGSDLAAARWKGHTAKRPASSRKKPKKKK
jgi:hypothetical protein